MSVYVVTSNSFLSLSSRIIVDTSFAVDGKEKQKANLLIAKQWMSTYKAVCPLEKQGQFLHNYC